MKSASGGLHLPLADFITFRLAEHIDRRKANIELASASISRVAQQLYIDTK